MGRKVRIESEMVALFSRWIGKSQVRVRVRKIGHGEKIIVDLFVLQPEGHSVSRTQRNGIAIKAAIREGATCADFTLIYNQSIQRRAQRLDGTITVTNVEELSYVFNGVI